ncbi:MAG: histidine kinase [Proteobacteria bacterium]|nr:histidine kinase [Pseudomonadota bacterium]
MHIRPGADFTSEAAEQLAPHLSVVVQRPVTDAASLAAALHEQDWRAVICDKPDRTPNSFLDSLPGMACQIRLDKQGIFHLPYVSEGCFDLLGLTATELEQHSQILISYLHPDDAESFHQSMLLSANHATPWNWEGRIILPHGGHARPPLLNPLPPASEEANESLREILVDEIKWVNLRAKYHHDDSEGTHWKGFVVNITQNKQAEIEITQYSQRLRELSAHIESIKEEERLRIAREIHDEIGVLLTALKMDLSWLKQRLSSENSSVQEKIMDMSSLLDTAGKSANNLVHSLRPGSLDCFGIVAAIEIEANEFTKRTGIPCKVSRSRGSFCISNDQSITLFRVFQEAMNNIMKHAAARHVEVQILKSGNDQNSKHVELIISDDGCGFDEAARNKPRSFGLRGIQERIHQLGGTVDIASIPAKGTKIAVRLPIKI